MNTIDTETLRDGQLQGRKFFLVDTLPEQSFARGHLPGAINIVSDDILQRAPDVLPDRNAPVVVYCASAACKRAGYTQVHHFVGGKKIWVGAGLPLA